MKTLREFSEIVLHLRSFINEHACASHQWYVGLASDAEEKLFQHHKVNRQANSWIYRMADSPEAARSVHENFLRLGCDGEQYPNELNATDVYIYLKSHKTKP